MFYIDSVASPAVDVSTSASVSTSPAREVRSGKSDAKVTKLFFFETDAATKILDQYLRVRTGLYP